MERLSEIKKLGNRLDEIRKETREIKKEIENIGLWVTKDLTKIDGWKNMVQNCLWHYEEHPEDFLNWCEYSVKDGKLLVTKGYSNDPDDYVFLEIDLDTPLESQVKTATVRKTIEADVAEKRKLKERYDSEMVVLRNMGMEELSFDEWKERIKVK